MIAKVRIHDKRQRVSKSDLVRFQIYLFTQDSGIRITDLESDCLVYLCSNQSQDLNTLCDNIAATGVTALAQSARNAFEKLSKKGLVVKCGKNKKKISLTPGLADIKHEGNILLNIQLLCADDTN